VSLFGVRTRNVVLGLLVLLVLAGVGGWAIDRHGHRSGTPVQRAVRSVHDARPLLLPSKIPAGWKAQPKASRSFFSVTYTGPGGDVWVRVAIAVPDPPLPDAATMQKTMRFRGDAKADYEIHGPDRFLFWWEPGTWTSHTAGERTDAVPYELTGHAIDESQFLAIARSLQALS